MDLAAVCGIRATRRQRAKAQILMIALLSLILKNNAFGFGWYVGKKRSLLMLIHASLDLHGETLKARRRVHSMDVMNMQNCVWVFRPLAHNPIHST